VKLLGSQNIEDYTGNQYPHCRNRNEMACGTNNILKQDNAMVSGKGIVHAQGKPFWESTGMRREMNAKGL